MFQTNLLNVNKSSKAPSTAISIEWFHWRNLPQLKYLVQASVTSTAYKWVAFVHHRSVDAIWLWTTRRFIISLATALWYIFQLSTTDFNISYWHIHLQKAAKSGISHLNKIILVSFICNPEMYNNICTTQHLEYNVIHCFDSDKLATARTSSTCRNSRTFSFGDPALP